jgi:hypothetical protein
MTFLDMLGVFVFYDDGYFLGRGNVETGLDFEGRRESVEVPFQFT